jgi:FkbM family methyltransferase
MSLRTLRDIFNHPLNKGRRLKAYLRYVKWHIGSRLAPGDVVYNWVDQIKFIAATKDTGLIGNIYCGLWDFQEMAYTFQVLTKEDLFVDVGANIGAYTLLACAGSGARGYSIEPIPSVFSKLMTNVYLNKLANRVVCLNIGIGAEKDTTLFTSDQDSMNHVVSKDEDAYQTVNVPILPLDTVLQNDSPSMLKIDVEGYEVPVLRGATQTLKSESLHSVILEMNGRGRRYGFDDKCIMEIMKSVDFNCYNYDPFSRQLRIIKDKKGYAKNVLFIRDIEYVRERVKNAPAMHINDIQI